ncbi:hypothetical protein C8Q74DRAFT_252075 [Fomes fomentarius]|nr:hypothetical protein C8Q74DRAFT_252075 [Fomes fomentarius]
MYPSSRGRMQSLARWVSHCCLWLSWQLYRRAGTPPRAIGTPIEPHCSTRGGGVWYGVIAHASTHALIPVTVVLDGRRRSKLNLVPHPVLLLHSADEFTKRRPSPHVRLVYDNFFSIGTGVAERVHKDTSTILSHPDSSWFRRLRQSGYHIWKAPRGFTRTAQSRVRSLVLQIWRNARDRAPRIGQQCRRECVSIALSVIPKNGVCKCGHVCLNARLNSRL